MGQAYTSSVGNPPVCVSMAHLTWRQKGFEYLVNYVAGARATTYYFSNSAGNDANNGLSTGLPKKTLAAAAAILVANNATPAAGGIAILFKRGDVWATTVTPLLTTAPHVTVGTYGAGAKPILSAFLTQYVGGTWTANSGIYFQNIAGEVSRLRDVLDVAAPWIRVDTLARCQAQPRSYFYDPTGNAGSGRLWANFPDITADATHWPNTEVALTNTGSGMSAAGDDTLIDGIRWDGYGTSLNFTGTQGYAVQVGTGTTDTVVVRDCEGYYTGFHGMGHFATAAGISAWIGNTTAWMDNDGTGGGSNFVGYSGTGGHEVWFFGNTCLGGGAPCQLGAFDGRYGMSASLICHTTSGSVNLMVEDGTVVIGGQYQTVSPPSNNNPIAWSDLINCRSFRSNMDFRVSPLAYPPGNVRQPTGGPTFTHASSGGTVLTGAYGAVVTYVQDDRESTRSAESTTTTTANVSTLTVNSPVGIKGVTGWRAYVGAAGGPWYLQGGTNGIGQNLTITAPPAAVTQPPADSGKQNYAQGNTSDPYTANTCCSMPKMFRAFNTYPYLNSGIAGAGFFYRCRHEMTVQPTAASIYNIGIIDELGTSRWYYSELSITAPEATEGFGLNFGTANFGTSGGAQAAVVKNSKLTINAGASVPTALGIANTVGNLSNNAYYGMAVPSADPSPVTGGISGPHNQTKGSPLYAAGSAAITEGSSYAAEYDFFGRRLSSLDIGSQELSSATAGSGSGGGAAKMGISI